MTINKILIANRAEIALRVIKTCKEMGIKTVSIYTDIEKTYPHAFCADESFCLGDGPLSDTYLNQDLLVKIAKDFGVDAIHPGYGLLSENPQFARRLAEEGITLVGPTPEAMELMGDKISSKIRMEEIGAPLIHGYHGDIQDSKFLKDEAEKIGFPVMIKATAGGGGKGMRVVHELSDFYESLEAARSEALKSFGNSDVLIEKFIQNPRHIEVQVMSDSHGNHFHFYERECSIQRRHQKIIEESPSPVLTEKLRKEICESAVKISRSINYLGAGTVEYILSENGEFFFLEMNTRLQVEHPITEMVTGTDLVRLQIIAAQGGKFDFSQSDISQRGHAIEVRIYAEDPDNNFLPSIGTITSIGNPRLNNIRFDSGFVSGNEVTINFDPMLAKLIAWGQNREHARKKILLSLTDTAFVGIKTNKDYLARVLNHQAFINGEANTNFVETFKDDLVLNVDDRGDYIDSIAAYLFAKDSNAGRSLKNGPKSVEKNSWDNLVNFRNS